MHVPDDVKADLKRRENVVGVGVGPKRRDGEEVDEESIVVFVTEKLPESELDPEDICPETVDVDDRTVRTDVVEAGEVRFLETATESVEDTTPDRTSRIRPAPASVSVGHPEITAGTLGSPPLKTDAGDLAFLTNAHVAAPPEAEIGDPCLQPGPEDGGTLDDGIGTLLERSEIPRTEPAESDSALVSVEPGALRENDILEIGPLEGFGEPTFDDEFLKSGRTTGLTDGELRARDVEIDVGGYYPDDAVTFTGVDAFSSMASGGDSGSLIGVATADGFRATNLLFAGSPLQTFGIPMAAVEAEHGDLAVANPPGDGDVPDPGEPNDRSLFERLIDFLRRLVGGLFGGKS